MVTAYIVKNNFYLYSRGRNSKMFGGQQTGSGRCLEPYTMHMIQNITVRLNIFYDNKKKFNLGASDLESLAITNISNLSNISKRICRTLSRETVKRKTKLRRNNSVNTTKYCQQIM